MSKPVSPSTNAASNSLRLDKFLANNSYFSRSDCQKLLRAGRIQVNQQSHTNGAIKINLNDRVFIDKVEIIAAEPVYLAMNKPAGVECAHKSHRYDTVFDLVDVELLQQHAYSRAPELQVAGRLDVDTTGLVLLTSDGDWNHRVTSPNYHCEKVYEVELAEPLCASIIERFAQGVMLDGEKKRTLPAKLTILDTHSAELVISEGRYHQVKRMFAAVGNHVESLRRRAIGEITLGDDLSEGECRKLTSEEVNSFEKHT